MLRPITQWEWNVMMTGRLKAIFALLFMVMAATSANLYFSEDGMCFYRCVATAWMLGYFSVILTFSYWQGPEICEIFRAWAPIQCVMAFVFAWLFGYNVLTSQDFHVFGTQSDELIPGVEMLHRYLMLLALIGMAFVAWNLGAYAKQKVKVSTPRLGLFHGIGVMSGGFFMVYQIMALFVLFDYVDGQCQRSVLIITWITVALQWLMFRSKPTTRQAIFYRLWMVISLFGAVVYAYVLYYDFKGSKLSVNANGKIEFDTCVSVSKLFRDTVQFMNYFVLVVLSKMLADCHESLDKPLTVIIPQRV